MTKPKWPVVIANKEKYPDADYPALAKLSDCDVRCVERAMKRPEAAHLIKSAEEILATVQHLDYKNVDAVELLFRNLIKVNSVEVPSIQAINALITFLDKTQQLVPKNQDDALRERISKLSIKGLVSVATDSPVDESGLYQ